MCLKLWDKGLPIRLWGGCSWCQRCNIKTGKEFERVFNQVKNPLISCRTSCWLDWTRSWLLRDISPFLLLLYLNITDCFMLFKKDLFGWKWDLVSLLWELFCCIMTWQRTWHGTKSKQTSQRAHFNNKTTPENNPLIHELIYLFMRAKLPWLNYHPQDQNTTN